MIWIRVLLVLLLIFGWRTVAVLYKPNDDAHGLRMALNDNFVVAAFNHENKYHIRFLSTNKDTECIIPYNDPELYVYSLCVLKKKKQSKIFSFVQISENAASNDAILSRVTFTLKNCNSSSPVTTFDKTVWKTGHKESMILEVDPQEKYAYVFADSFILSYDLSTNEVRHNRTFHAFNKTVIPTAVDLTNEWAFMIGYTPSARSEFGYPHFYIVDLLSKNLLECNHSDNKFLSFISTQNIYSQNHGISISIDPSENLLAMGVSVVNQVYIFETSRVKYCSFKSIDNIQPASHLNTIGIGFGRSVAWLDNQGIMLAVLVHNFKNQVQPKSEIHVFKTGSKNNRSQHVPPDFIFPNNQQMLPKNWTRKSFLFILAHSNNLLILCDNHRYLYIPYASTGSRSVLLDEKPKSAFVLEPTPCVSGTYKNTSDIGPCTVCPPETKNWGDHPAIKCQPCDSGSFCPLGSTGDIPYDEFMLYESYNQTFEYPETPIVDDYDDILMRNFFVLEDTIDCMLKLPRIWAFMAIGLGFIVWLLMFLIKRRQPTRVDIHRKRAKILLKQIDIIGEGEQLVGGLASLVVLIIIIHSCWFANDYFHSYPFETAKSSRLLCKNNQTNTKFDNALQLPLPKVDSTYDSIFDMLNKQKFTMIIHLINTGARCDNITVERVKHIGTAETIPIYNCTLLNHNVTGSFAFDLLTHTDYIQVSIEGPYFIGALRICLYGPKSLDKLEEQKRHRVEELDVCTLFYKDNQTIGLTNTFNVHLIKVINITEPLRIMYETNYTGRWAPYIKYTGDLADKHYFKKDGEYLRYTSLVTTFNVEINEEFYFLLNNQSPIVRLYELIFHTFLFNFLVIDIVAMIFVIYKLWCQPPLRRILLRRRNTLTLKLQSSHIETVIDSPSLLPRSTKSKVQLTAKLPNAQSSKNFEENLTTSDQASEQLTVEHFNKRFEAVAQNIEQLIYDVATMRNQINETIADVIHLKHHIPAIDKTNNNVDANFSTPQTEQ